MKYVTLSEMCWTIRNNFHKIPHDIDFVLGVPRSGVICASIISEFLNAPFVDVTSFCSGAVPTGGGRLRYHTESVREKKKVLVVDDTIYNGNAMRRVRQQLAPFSDRYDFTYMVVYREGNCVDVDFWLDDLRKYTTDFPIVLYEWNIFHHITNIMAQCIYDMDGVLCVDPPDERNENEYLNYIINAVPLFTPTTEIGQIVSYRLSKNEEITKRWLSEHNIRYKGITLFPAKTYEERANSGISPAAFKADIYKHSGWAKLFVESDDIQAQKIRDITRKPVYCVGSNKLYQ